MRRVLLLAGVIGLLVALAVPAHAAKPEVVDEFENETVMELDEFLSDEVCGFNVYLTESVRGITKDYFDKNGDFVRGTFKIRGTTIWSSDTTSLPPEHWAWNGTFDAADGTFAERGNHWNVHDGGPVLMQKGRILAGDEGPIQLSGQWPLAGEDGFDPSGFAPLCDALAP